MSYCNQLGITTIGGLIMKSLLVILSIILNANHSFAYLSNGSGVAPAPTAFPTIIPPPPPPPSPSPSPIVIKDTFHPYVPQDPAVGPAGPTEAGSTGLNMAAANPQLWPCIHAPVGIPLIASDYDCTPTPRDSSGKISGTNTNYRNWDSVLFQQNSQTPVNGYYSKNGTRCTTSIATNECPVAVKVKFVYNCDTSDSNNYKNGKCLRASTIEAYHAIYQEKTIPGEAPIKPIIVGDSNVDGNAITATPISTNALAGLVYNGFACSSISPMYIQLGTDKYGAPICGVDPNQQTIDKMQVKMCEIETAQVKTSGGATTTCTPNIVVIKLVGGSHLASDCTGTLVDLDGKPVSNPTVANNQKLFCKINAASCPSSWVQRDNWSATTKKCDKGYFNTSQTGTNGNATNNASNGCWGAQIEGLISNIENTCTNEHAFGNFVQEKANPPDWTINACSWATNCAPQAGGYYNCGNPRVYQQWDNNANKGSCCTAWWTAPTKTIFANITAVGCI